MLKLDICAEILPLADEQVEWLIARASCDAGRSSRCRDLAALLRMRCRSPRPTRSPLALRRFEARTLATLLEEHEREAAATGVHCRS